MHLQLVEAVNDQCPAKMKDQGRLIIRKNVRKTRSLSVRLRGVKIGGFCEQTVPESRGVEPSPVVTKIV